MEQIKDAETFARLIRVCLQQNPEWLPTAFSAVSHGSELALAQLKRRAADSDAAALAALCLADTKRLPAELRATLLDKITKPMNPSNLCDLERRFAAKAIEARRAETGTGSVHESAVRQDAPEGGQ